MAYQVVYQPSAERQLRKLPRALQRRILNKTDTLAIDPLPHGVEKLSGESDLWRIRIGDYRVIYHLRHKQLLVLVLKIGHRREVYR